MSESVFLRFTPPDREKLVKLHIYEEDSVEGPWDSIIESVVEIGSYPDYIDEWTTDQATSKLNWFAIQWEDEDGAVTEISNPLQGGTTTFVGEIVSLVNERDHTLDPQVVRQEAEVAIEVYFGQDPYTVNGSTVSYRVKVGLARLVQARVLMNSMATGSSGSDEGWTAGLVSMKSGSSSGGGSRDDIEWLLADAARMLGFGISRVAQMAEIQIAGGLSRIVTADISRLLIEVE